MKLLKRLEKLQNSGNNKFLLFLFQLQTKNVDKKVMLCYNIFKGKQETKI